MRFGTISSGHPNSTEGLKLPDAAVQRRSKKPGGHRVEPGLKHDENRQEQQLAITRGFAGRDGHTPTAPRRRVAFLYRTSEPSQPRRVQIDKLIRGPNMHLALTVLCLGICISTAAAQPRNEDKKPGDSPWSTGRTVLPDNKGQLQPQGWTGPPSTGSGGAPATSPQGGTPPDMQPAPGGASQTIVDPNPAPTQR